MHAPSEAVRVLIEAAKGFRDRGSAKRGCDSVASLIVECRGLRMLEEAVGLTIEAVRVYSKQRPRICQ
jgi:hypothetical protein